ncbi:hypothetical protein ABZ464_21020 [Streptomyces sp. NPDC005820]|uniref:hypothetical protein n=1 Tax=Streptomyces sp. NPDC005820 TaxID=3157069 RepID=UPI0033FAFF28
MTVGSPSTDGTFGELPATAASPGSVEATTREVPRSGTPGVDQYGLRARLLELGVVHQD